MTPRPREILSFVRRALPALACCVAATVVGAPLTITSDAPIDAVPSGGQVTIRGQAAPLAMVHAQVLGIPSAVGVTQGVQTLYDDTLTAGPDGSFAITFAATDAARYEVQVDANADNDTATTRLTLFGQR
jgi:hypothetical protein